MSDIQDWAQDALGSDKIIPTPSEAAAFTNLEEQGRIDAFIEEISVMLKNEWHDEAGSFGAYSFKQFTNKGLSIIKKRFKAAGWKVISSREAGKKPEDRHRVRWTFFDAKS